MKTKTISARHALKIVLLTTILVNISTLAMKTKFEKPTEVGTPLEKDFLKIVKTLRQRKKEGRPVTISYEREMERIAPKVPREKLVTIKVSLNMLEYHINNRNNASDMIDRYHEESKQIKEKFDSGEMAYDEADYQIKKINRLITRSRRGRSRGDKSIIKQIDIINNVLAEYGYKKNVWYQLYPQE